MADRSDDIDSLLQDASEAAKTILENAERGERIWVESHLDADGIAAASIVGKALSRLEADFRIRVERWFDEKIVDQLASEKPGLIIFTDMGSGYLDILGAKLSEKDLIILDHHQPTTEKIPESFVQVNPHLRGIDGSRDLSGAGVAYLVAKKLNESNIDLAHLAVIGALGDIQDKYEQRSLGGVNKLVVDDAVESGCLQVETDLLFFGRETRPIHKALAYTTDPYIPGISGKEDQALALITNLNIRIKEEEKWRALRDLSQDEKKMLFSALAEILASRDLDSDIAMKLIGTVYTLDREEPWTPIRDAREFALLLNATGRTGKPSLGIAVCIGDRGTMLAKANTALEEYRRSIMTYLNWLSDNPERIEELESIYVIHGENSIDEKMISAISTILSTNMPKRDKPVIGYSVVPDEGVIKVSARANEFLIGQGLNLGKILGEAAEKNMGKGGGHDIAAGGQVPYEKKKEFIDLLDKLVRDSLRRKKLGS